MITSNIFIAYISPSGSTRHVAGIIESTLTSLPATSHVLDLTAKQDCAFFLERIRHAGENDCLFIGSPVYRDMAVPPLMAFIREMPYVPGGCYAAPFVTWGGASSGIALWQMGQALVEKGFSLAGAAKIVGVHSLMWQSPEPAAYGHPNAEDDQALLKWVEQILYRLNRRALQPIDPAVLDYQSEPHKSDMKEKLNQPWKIIPKTVDQAACTQCGLCESECPVSAITLTPFPTFADTCFDCFNCIRLCPENAIAPAVSFEQIEQHIRSRVTLFNEDRKPGIFYLK